VGGPIAWRNRDAHVQRLREIVINELVNLLGGPGRGGETGGSRCWRVAFGAAKLVVDFDVIWEPYPEAGAVRTLPAPAVA
jgi:hypothetical protein